jgi:hypothetical protein
MTDDSNGSNGSYSMFFGDIHDVIISDEADEDGMFNVYVYGPSKQARKKKDGSDSMRDREDYSRLFNRLHASVVKQQQQQQQQSNKQEEI